MTLVQKSTRKGYLHAGRTAKATRKILPAVVLLDSVLVK